MPNVNEYSDEKEWMKVCVPKLIGEGRDQDQAVAACMSMWKNKGAEKSSETIMDTTKTLFGLPVKAIGDWELDVLAIPFNSKDSDGQWFDADTDIMPDAFSTPLAVYQHGIKQGAKSLQDKPVIIGKTQAGTLEKKSDGWHIRVILDKLSEYAKAIMDAAKLGLVAVSSGSISHLARLEINGKKIMYEKDRPGRIAVWPFAEISLWESGNGNMQPANRFAVALPAMKAIYREAGLPFPDVVVDTDGDSPEAKQAAKRAKIKQQARAYLLTIQE